MAGQASDGASPRISNASALTASPPDFVPIAHQIGGLMVSLMNLTEPSVSRR